MSDGLKSENNVSDNRGSNRASGTGRSSGDPNTFKFVISSDNHLGFLERDPRRGDDSFVAFEEVLRAARVEHEADALLLGGDLFHMNKPSLGCLARSSSLFHKYVLGNKAGGAPLTLLSDPAVNFPTHTFPLANFQNPNINVALPVFAIHGNHDDPVGGTSSLDLLAAASFINYFGHADSLEDIVIRPVLLRKGRTYVALYGLGNVRDERLHRCFQLKKVRFQHPEDPPEPRAQWFKILLLHQNRGVRGANSKNGIFESALAGSEMDVVIWGNEHEQQMVAAPTPYGFAVIQPGSTVRTSITAQESNPKQYGVLEVRGTAYRLTAFDLRYVRPAVQRSLVLRRDNPGARHLEAVEAYLRSTVESMVADAEAQLERMPDEVLQAYPALRFPLMRLSVDFTDPGSVDYPMPLANRFGQEYMDVVASPDELLRPVRPRPGAGVGVGTTLGRSDDKEVGPIVPVGPLVSVTDIRSKIAQVFNQQTQQDGCTLLSEPELSMAVYAFAEKGEKAAIDEKLMELLNNAQKSIWRKFSNGKSEGILDSAKVFDAAREHKEKINDEYRAHYEDEMTVLNSHAAADDAASGALDGSATTNQQRQGEATATITTTSTFDRLRGDFDRTTRPPPPAEAATHNPLLEGDKEDPFMNNRGTSSNSRNNLDGATAVKTEANEEEAELPDAGIDVQGFFEDALATNKKSGTTRKRGRDVQEVVSENDYVDVDDDNDDGVRTATTTKTTKRGGTAAKKAKTSTRAIASGGGGGRRGGKTSAAPNSGPALQLASTVLDVVAPPRDVPSKKAPASDAQDKKNHNPAMLNLLSQWGQ